MNRLIALVVCGMFMSPMVSNALGLKMVSEKTQNNDADTQNLGAGGVVKGIVDRLDKAEANFQGTNELLDESASGLKKIARNDAAEKELNLQIKALEIEAKKSKQDKKSIEAMKKDKEFEFWTDTKNLTEAKRKGVSSKNREELLGFGAKVGVAIGGIADQTYECKKLGEEIPKITPDKVKEEMKGNPMQAAKTVSRLKNAPGTIASMQKEVVTQGKRLAVLSTAIKFMTTAD